jgi:hypothetical protein
MEQQSDGGWTESMGSEATNPPHPRTSGETIFALGREWTVSSCENRIKAQFEQWVRRNAKKAIAEAEAEDGPEEADAQRSAYAAARGAGHYDWDGRYCRNARGDLPGIRHLLFLLLRRCHPDITEEQTAAIFREAPKDCGLALRWALGNSESPAESKAGDDGEKRLTKEQWLALQQTGKDFERETTERRKREKTPTTLDGP